MIGSTLTCTTDCISPINQIFNTYGERRAGHRLHPKTLVSVYQISAPPYEYWESLLNGSNLSSSELLLFGIVLAGGDKTTALFGSGMRSQSDPFFNRFLQGLS
jgi:hypothetical protein